MPLLRAAKPVPPDGRDAPNPRPSAGAALPEGPAREAVAPEAIARVDARWVQAAIAGPALFGAVAIAALAVGAPVSLAYAAVVVNPATMFIGALLLGRRGRRRLLARARACDHTLCAACLHDLRGMPERGRCPECGHAYALADTHARWLRADRHEHHAARGERA